MVILHIYGDRANFPIFRFMTKTLNLGDVTSSPFPACRVWWSGAFRSGPAVVQTCHTGCTWGRGVYLTPGSQLYHALGSAKTESGGWSGLTPHPGTPLPGTGALISVLGRRPDKSGPPCEVGGGASRAKY